MSISQRKLAANRANAQKSTGPTSEAGKQIVSQNRTTHGLCGRFKVQQSENQAAYDSLLERFLAAEEPADDVERELVAKMARHTWLSERCFRFQEACFIMHPQTPDQLAQGRSLPPSSTTSTHISVTRPTTTAPTSKPPRSWQDAGKKESYAPVALNRNSAKKPPNSAVNTARRSRTNCTIFASLLPKLKHNTPSIASCVTNPPPAPPNETGS